MGRLLGLDIGEKTIGLAVSDAGGLVASPLRTIARQGGDHDIAAVRQAREETGAQALVLGLPLALDGSEGVSARRARRLGRALHAALDCAVHYQDERFSTVAAERVLKASKLSRQKRKAVVDRVAAVVILQNWLDRHADRQGDVLEARK